MTKQHNGKGSLKRAQATFLVVFVVMSMLSMTCHSFSFRVTTKAVSFATPSTATTATSTEDFSLQTSTPTTTASESKSVPRKIRITKKQFSKAAADTAAIVEEATPAALLNQLPSSRQKNKHHRRELAGVESMFSMSKRMRKVPIGRLTESWKRRWNRRVQLKQQRLHEKQQQHGKIITGDSATVGVEEHTIANLDAFGIEQARQNLHIPSWACVDTDEERRLAAMKILLQDELEAISKKTITIQTVNEEDGKTKTVKKRVVDVFPDVYGDLRLLRFLRKDTIQDPVTAAGRYSDFLTWRQENNVDEIRAKVEAQGPFHTPPELAIVGDYLPNNFQVQPDSDNKNIMHTGDESKNKNKKGQAKSSAEQTKATIPVFLHIGTWDTDTITKHIRSNTLPLEKFLQYWTYMFESLYSELHERSLALQEMVYIDEICDLNKMNLQQFSPSFVSTVLKPFVNLTQKNYPETAASIVLLNPPRILNMVWKILTPMVSPSTVAKIRLHAGFAGTCIDFFNQQLQQDQKKPNPALQP